MGKLRFLLTAMLTLPLLLSAQQIVSKPTQTFRDNTLKLSLAIPAGLALAPPQESQAAIKKELDGKGTVIHAIGDCLSIPLNASRSDLSFLLILQLTLSGECAGIPVDANTLHGYSKNTLNGSLTRIGPNSTMQEPVTYQLNGQLAELTFGTTTVRDSPSVTLYGAATCTIIGKNLVCWEVIAASKDDLRDLLQSAITIDGSTAVPLVPISLIKQ